MGQFDYGMALEHEHEVSETRTKILSVDLASCERTGPSQTISAILGIFLPPVSTSNIDCKHSALTSKPLMLAARPLQPVVLQIIIHP